MKTPFKRKVSRLRKRFGDAREMLREYGCDSSDSMGSAVARLIAEHRAASKRAAELEEWGSKCMRERDAAWRLRDEAQAAGTKAVVARQEANATARFYKAAFEQLREQTEASGDLVRSTVRVQRNVGPETRPIRMLDAFDSIANAFAEMRPPAPRLDDGAATTSSESGSETKNGGR